MISTLFVIACWCFCSSISLSPSNRVDAFSVSSPALSTRRQRPRLQHAASQNDFGDMFNDGDRTKALEFMKNMKPEDVDAMIADLDRLPEGELKSMGMNVEVMKATLQMAKKDPSILQTMTQVMESMSAEEIIEKSREAQQALKSTVKTAEVVAATEDDDEEKADDDDDDEDEEEPVEPDAKVLDAMYAVAELMSAGDAPGVTFAAFKTVPPIAVLSGTDGENDLTPQELTECWNAGSLGATRVDRAGFERVWRAAQSNYYSDLVEEAQDRLVVAKKRKRGSEKSAAAAPGASSSMVPTTTASPAQPPLVGSSISPDQLSNQVKNIKDEDLTGMFDKMSQMTPAEEARMRAMGVDPEMMKKSAEMMKKNPLLRKAATMAIKNTSPDQLLKASQQAQERMANMSEEEKKKMLENLK